MEKDNGEVYWIEEWRMIMAKFTGLRNEERLWRNLLD